MSSDAPIKRKEDGTFAEGTSGNAGGVAKWQRELQEALRTRFEGKGLPVIDKILERAAMTEALERVIESKESPPENVLRAEKDMQARLELAARVTIEIAKLLLPRPVQRIELESNGRPLMEFTTEDMRNFRGVLRASSTAAKASAAGA